jgi:hypothetical protein
MFINKASELIEESVPSERNHFSEMHRPGCVLSRTFVSIAADAEVIGNWPE